MSADLLHSFFGLSGQEPEGIAVENDREGPTNGTILPEVSKGAKFPKNLTVA
ncbi:MAG: hypothetical protein OHK0029_14700 [Armatimonadaceae bacterium]